MIKMIAEFRLRRLGLFIVPALNQDISLLALIGNITNHFINLNIIVLFFNILHLSVNHNFPFAAKNIASNMPGTNP
jgi:hypothetical protein